MSDMKYPYLQALDDHFCARYSDYVKLSALPGYVMPEMLYLGKDGNIARKSSEEMRLVHQKNCEELLKTFKASLMDTNFTFSFSFIPFSERVRDRFRKYTFAKVLPAVLARCHATAESAGAKLDIEPQFWTRIVKGKLYPEKNTVLALALVCRMRARDASNLLAVCGFPLDEANVRDVVVEYLLTQQIFNEEMRDNCLAEYKITNLPIKR